MCCTRLAKNIERKNYAKNRHLRTIAQLYRDISSQLRNISTIGKKLLNGNLLHIRHSKPGRLFPNPGFGFGFCNFEEQQTSERCVRHVQVRELRENTSVDPCYDAALHYAEEHMILSFTSHQSPLVRQIQ